MAFRDLVAMLGAQTYGVVRALAIALYVVFAVLALLASQRGHRGIGALVVVSGGVPDRWSGVRIELIPRRSAAGSRRWCWLWSAAVVMTQRLTAPPFRRDGPPPPYPPGGRMP